MLGKAALVVASLAMLFIIIGLATPISVTEFDMVISSVTVKAKYVFGIKDAETYTNDQKTATTDYWDEDQCTGSTADDCKKTQSMLKAGFAFCLLGMLTNVALIVALAAKNGFVQLPMLTGMIAIAGIGAVTSLFYFIGCVSANSAVQEGLGSSNANFKDETSPGAGGALLCLGLIFAVIATGLGVAAPSPATQQAGSSTETVEPAEPKEMQAVSP